MSGKKKLTDAQANLARTLLIGWDFIEKAGRGSLAAGVVWRQAMEDIAEALSRDPAFDRDAFFDLADPLSARYRNE